MIRYEVSINKLNPRHFNDARYAYEVCVFNNGHPSPYAGEYGCTLTLSGAKRKLRRELRKINNILSPDIHSQIITAQGSIEDLEALMQ